MLFVQEDHASYRPATTEELSQALQSSLVSLFTRTSLNSPDKVKPFLSARYALQNRETLGIVALSNSLEFLAIEEIAQGDVNSVNVSSRAVIEAVLKHPSTQILLFHNHPSGTKSPSADDLAFTRRCVDIFKLIDVKLLDHFIVAGSEVVSIRESHSDIWY